MNILSINMCGMKDRVKRKRVARLCSQHGVSFLGVQETRASSINLFDVRSMWGNFSFEFVVASARGLSGGILSMWDPSAFKKTKIISMENALIVEGEWVFKKMKCYMINVYAPQQDSHKRMLWETLTNFILGNDGEFVVFGDFNAVRNRGERWGCAYSHREATDFNSFISDAGLMEVAMGGFGYTRVSPNGDKMSKIDRFFITAGVEVCFPELYAMACDNNIADHRPICLKEALQDYGPRPFRFFNSWM